MDSDPLADEILTIDSIYPEGIFALSDHDSTTGKSRICTLRIPSIPSIVLRIEFPAEYPNEPPTILGTESVGSNVPKGAGNVLVERAKEVVERVWRGECMVFDLIEELEKEQIELAEKAQNEAGPATESQEQPESEVKKDESLLGEEPPWILIPAVTDRKSVFLARCVPVTSPSQAQAYLNHLISTDKKVAKASHNMSAYRIRGQNGSNATYQDSDDDGETAAGTRMLHLMQLMDVWDVMVVVSRWFGGIHLGPDRFRIINNVARDVLVEGGFVKSDGKKK